MKKHLSTSDSNLIPKKLSDTRWSVRTDATKALSLGYSCFRNALEELITDNNRKQTIRVEAQSLANSLNKLEIAIICEIWSILQKFNATNKSLQNVNIDLETVVKLYNSLKNYLLNLRTTENFLNFEKSGIEKSGCEEYNLRSNRKRKRHFHEGAEAETVFDARNSMKIKVYFAILDNLINALEKRAASYKYHSETFGFLNKLQLYSEFGNDQLRVCAKNLVEIYNCDLEDEFTEEIIQFRYFIQNEEFSSNIPLSVSYLKLIRENKIQATFPNVEVAIRIYLCLALTNSSGERLFSALKRVKNAFRSTLGQEKLNNLSILNIESEFPAKLNFDDVIKIFSEKKP